MVIGGAYIASNSNKQQAEPAYAEDGDVVATFDSEDVITYQHREHIRNGWKVSWGGSYRCGFDSGEWKTIEEQGYTKYINQTTISPDVYGWVVATQDALSYVGEFDYSFYSIASNASFYLTYSLDGENYYFVDFIEGEQGSTVTKNKTTFTFNSIRKAYYAVIVTSSITSPKSNELFTFYKALFHFCEKIDPAAQRITVSGSDAVYVDEDIELAITAYNINPSSYSVTCSDNSIATASVNGNKVIVHGVKKGNTSIVVTADGTNGEVYTDPFAINVKKFDFDPSLPLPASIKLSRNTSTQIARNRFVDPEGDEVDLKAVSENTDVATTNVDDDCLVVTITAGNIGGVSTTITFTARDKNGAEGCHVATATIEIIVRGNAHLGDRLSTTSVDANVIIGTRDKTRFLKVDDDYGTCVSTDRVDCATIFQLYGLCLLYGDGFVSDEFGGLTVAPWSFSFEIVSYNAEYSNFLMNPENGNVFYLDDSSISFLNFHDIGDYLEDDEINSMLCLYYAIEDEPSIAPTEDSAELIKGASTDIDAELTYVKNATYEIISGAECIEEVTITKTDVKHINVHIEASSINYGKAIIRVKDANDGSVYHDIAVTVKADTTAVESLSTQAKLSYSYSKNEENITLSDVAIRFGGQIDKTVWNALNDGENGANILGYGVMLAKSNEVNAASIENAYTSISATYGEFDNCFEVENGTKYLRTTTIKNFYNDVSTSPAEQGNYYYWNLYKSINASTIGLARSYTAVAYVRTASNGVVFLGEVSTSAAKLASEAITTIDNINETTEGSMEYLAGFYSQN